MTKRYLSWDEVQVGDFLETLAGDLEILGNTAPCYYKVSLSWFSAVQLDNLGIRAFRWDDK